MIVNLVCESSEETNLLYAALNDFSVGGPRAQYASWLDTQGDSDRAEAVRATIKAFQELDETCLADAAGDENWKRVIAIPLLECILSHKEAVKPNELRVLCDNVFKHIRPGLSLSYEESESEPVSGSSYLWGQPDLPVEQDWPLIAECSDWFGVKSELPQDLHCAFVGQFRFDDLKETLLGKAIPSTGGFSIFSISEVNSLGIHETVVRAWDPSKDLTRREPPEDLIRDPLGDTANNPQPFHTIILDEVISIPDATSPAFAGLIPGCKWNEPFNDLYCGMMSECDEEQLGIGGYLRSTSGDDPSPDSDHMRFAVLRVHPEAGVVHFAIPTADQKSGRLEGVKYVWSDWDG